MAGMLRPGANEVPRDALRQESILVAEGLQELLAPTYGPGGGAVLIDGKTPVTVWSGASALREAPLQHPAAEPYRSLAGRLQAVYGDQATTGVLLAANLVRRGLESGAPRAALVAGLQLARRQSLAWLRSQAGQESPEDCLASIVPEQPSWAPDVVAGLGLLQHTGLVDLDQISILERDGQTGWLDGLHLEVDTPRFRGPCSVLMLEAPPRDKTRSAMAARGGMEWQQAEASHDRSWYEALGARGVGLLVCRQGLGRHKEALERRMLVLDNAPADLWRRIEAATGASPGFDLDDARPGKGMVQPNPHRVGGHTLRAGASATFLVPTGIRAWRDDAERLLRAAGIVMDDPRATPAGWMEGLASHLRHAADAAPGKAPLVIRTVADSVLDLRRAALLNQGKDPLAKHAVAAGKVPSACLEAAIDAAFEAAISIIRLDGRYAKRPSSPSDLRGGTGPAGSPKGMPGDIPPLM